MDVDAQRHRNMPPKRVTTNVRSPSGERDTLEIDLTYTDVLGRDNLVLLYDWDTQLDQPIDLSDDEPLQGVVVRQFDRGMLKEVIAGIVAIAFSLLFLWAGYPALILPLLGMIAAYYFGSKSR
jgi:hypothetical protein